MSLWTLLDARASWSGPASPGGGTQPPTQQQGTGLGEGRASEETEDQLQPSENPPLMPRFQAHSEDGTPLEVHVPAILMWVLGIAGTLISASILGAGGMLLALNSRVAVMEERTITASELMGIVSDFVPRNEYTADQDDMRSWLGRVESKLDRALESR